MRKCPRCGLSKPEADFNSQGTYCLKCHNKNSREWRKRNLERAREIDLESYYRRKSGKGKQQIIGQGFTPEREKLVKDQQHRRYMDNREEVIEKVTQRRESLVPENTIRILLYQLEHPCVDCGESDPLVLAFDHVRGKKRFEISGGRNRAYPWETIASEIAKCDVRCYNCHARKTALERNYRRAEYLEEARARFKSGERITV